MSTCHGVYDTAPQRVAHVLTANLASSIGERVETRIEIDVRNEELLTRPTSILLR